MGAKVLGDDAAVPQRWLQFTPAVIDEGKCMARTWKGIEGQLGGQCNCQRQGGSEFCGRHRKQGESGRLAHGRVDGDIPEPKYQEFVSKSKK
jgi:hypothetical protein